MGSLLIQKRGKRYFSIVRWQPAGRESAGASGRDGPLKKGSSRCQQRSAIPAVPEAPLSCNFTRRLCKEGNSWIPEMLLHGRYMRCSINNSSRKPSLSSRNCARFGKGSRKFFDPIADHREFSSTPAPSTCHHDYEDHWHPNAHPVCRDV